MHCVAELEEDLAPLTEALEPPPVETYEDEITKVRQAANEVSWTHVMGKCITCLHLSYILNNLRYKDFSLYVIVFHSDLEDIHSQIIVYITGY